MSKQLEQKAQPLAVGLFHVEVLDKKINYFYNSEMTRDECYSICVFITKLFNDKFLKNEETSNEGQALQSSGNGETKQ